MADVSIIHPYLRTRENFSLPKNALCVGITGGMGSGKSTVTQLFKQIGWAVIDLDKMAQELTEQGGAAIKPLAQAFGESVITQDGALNRVAMREMVFNDKQAKQTLESILHPMIHDAAAAQAHRFAQTHRKIIFDIPLLAESEQWQKALDWIVVIDCPREIQIERIRQRNPNLPFPTIEAILNQQASREARRAIADAVIDNSPQNTVENRNKHLHLYTQINIIINKLQHYQEERL
ncbi:dephospho-CoA kinase [Formosimonas limnophila]|uniref:Dephospho-CoA kinase n=1 Tax=Formosimonas limnophila TaxID=1384487 RepID=A0A8J3CHZ2_9BURK|nr:dephospho-CoA kinase [Formosimonas limnophila]GHA76098.1 dephospho-CoA kinase [Formosimonas limnophila]